MNLKFLLKISLAILIFSFVLKAEQVQIDLNKGYTQDVWYSFKGGVVHSGDKDNWDIAFQNGANAGVRINGQKGLNVWVVPNSSDESWDDPIDISNIESWDTYINSVDSWNIGAFNLGIDGFETDGDFGWGYYDVGSHYTVGQVVFVIQLKDGSYKKFFIESLIGGIYEFKLADLDGANEITSTVKKSDYLDKSYIYYSIENNEVLDREPKIQDWDLLFGKYQTWYPTQDGNLMKYPLTGVRTKQGYLTAKLTGVNPETVSVPEISAFEPGITKIGADWKVLNQDFTYSVPADLVYFVTGKSTQNPDLPIYRIYFTGFEGSSTGLITFEVLEEGASSIYEDDNISGKFSIYPSIIESGESFNLVLKLNQTREFNVSVVDITGQVVYNNDFPSTSEFETHSINGFNAPAGMYMVVVKSRNAIGTQKIIIK